MSGGPLLPSSIYLGGASGELFPNFYIPATNTNAAGALEGVGCIASLGTIGNCVMQFNLPEVIPSGTMKLRALATANATTGNAIVNISDGVTAPGSNIGAATLAADSTITQAWSVADVLVENKVNLSSIAVANGILTVLAAFNFNGWTLAAVSSWQFSVVWE